jgi:dipeptidyl aminopeptidase/acylaminoacyl peptidase
MLRLASLALLFSFAATIAAQGATLTIDKMLDWETASSPRLSPDGKQVVWTRSWVDRIEDRTQSDLWIMNADGARARFLVAGSAPEWSPDGTRLAFLAPGQPRGTQIHVMWVDTRETTQITRVDESPRAVRWSPDGARLAFTMLVPEKPTFRVQLPKRPKGAKWAEEPDVITRLNYRRDRAGYRPKGFLHLFVVDAGGGTPRQVTGGDYDHQDGEWTPDGRRLVFSGLREADADWQVRESEVYDVEVDGGAVRRLTSRAGPDGSPAVSPDGQWIAYLGFDRNDDTYTVPALHVMAADGAQPRALTASLDREVGDLLWAEDSRAIYCTVSSEGRRNLHRVGLDGRIERLTDGVHQFAVDDLRAGVAVGTLQDPTSPADIALCRLAAPGEIARLTRVNDDVLAGVALASVEEIRYRSTDDLEIQGWIVKPPGFDPAKKYPLILQIHGGPHAMYGVDFSFERHNHAAAGYVLLYTNPRGSTGYGKDFGNAIDNAYPGKDYDDLMRGVDEVVARGYVDERELFVYGGSGGGVLTCWIVGHTDRFAAAVSMFPVTNWISFVGTTDGPYWYTNFDRLPWEDITEHWQRSPLKYVGNVKTPTLLITGELDLRTPIAQTEEYYQALKLRKIDTAMIRVPDEYHGAGGRRVSNTLRRILYVRKWFDKYRPSAPAERAVDADADRDG